MLNTKQIIEELENRKQVNSRPDLMNDIQYIEFLESLPDAGVVARPKKTAKKVIKKKAVKKKPGRPKKVK